MIYQISSSITLVVKIFLPSFWLAFFNAFTLIVLFTDKSSIGVLPTGGLRLGAVLFLASGVFIFYKMIYPLKRIDLDANYIYVSTYLKNVRYAKSDVVKLETNKNILFTFGSVILNGEGSFGKRLNFIASVSKFTRAMNALPDWKEKVQQTQ